VTDEGNRMLRAVRRRRTAWLAQRLGRLSPAELDALEEALAPLERLLEVDA
jgi:DNA-binding MarR family transcriptional regulator